MELNSFIDLLKKEHLEDVQNYETQDDKVILCNATTPRHIDSVLHELRSVFFRQNIAIEGASNSEWVICSLQFATLHIFTQYTRDYYALDALLEQGVENDC